MPMWMRELCFPVVHCHNMVLLTPSTRYVVLSLKPGIEFAFFDRIKSMILKVLWSGMKFPPFPDTHGPNTRVFTHPGISWYNHILPI